MKGVIIEQLGRLPFLEARRLQDKYVRRRIAGESGDRLLFCEHPPTLTIGKRSRETDIGRSIDAWQSEGVEVHGVSRGGSVTYHGPGQLVIYPVVSLRERGWGVRKFVLGGLQSLVYSLEVFGIDAAAVEQPAGVWLTGGGTVDRKIAAVGLKIDCGVTNHGFALNVTCDLAPFSAFTPCGVAGAAVTSVRAECGAAADVWQTAEVSCRQAFISWLA